MAIKTSTTRANNALDEILDGVNDLSSLAGYIEIRTGSIPANLAASATGTLLARCDLVDATQAAFAAASSLSAIGYTSGGVFAAEGSIVADGTAGYFRLYDYSDVAVMQGTVGTSGADLNLSSTSLVAGGTLDIIQFDVAIAGVT